MRPPKTVRSAAMIMTNALIDLVHMVKSAPLGLFNRVALLGRRVGRQGLVRGIRTLHKV
jgi:hypothetical protein